VNLRAKLLLVLLTGSLAPVLLVGAYFYRNSLNVVEGMLRDEVEAKTARIARDIEAALREREFDLNRLAQDRVLRRGFAGNIAATESAFETKKEMPTAPPKESPASQPDAAQGAIADFIAHHRDYYSAVTIVTAPPERRVPLRFEPPDSIITTTAGTAPARVKTGDLLPGQPRFDERVWTTSEAKPLRSDVTRDATGTPCIVLTVPVFSGESESALPRAALVAEVKLDSLLQDAGSDLTAAVSPPASSARESNTVKSSRLFVVLDGTGQVLYHTNHALKYQPIGAAMPYFDHLAREMRAGRSGTDFFTLPLDGTRWLASYKTVAGGNLSVAVAGNYTRAVESINRSGLLVFGLSLSLAVLAASLLFVIVTRATRRIARVTEAAAAIATTGDLNQRLEVSANDETHALAEGFNRMSDRLRELIAREAETRQFQSFVRLSAMLTHDLKNSITGLSMLVTNMERQYHRAEFREDAISSLKQATEKLGGLVARLSEPVKSLSGEYRRTPRPDDLIPIIRRALATTAAPSAAFYEIKTDLPESLLAPVDPERIERVIENLIVNAFEAMGARGGLLTVVAGEESEALVFFSVEDTGPGMTEEFVRTRLFRAFATTKRRGIGLGLYTCREMVEAHGGRLEVKTKLGSGTRFRVVLPSIPLMAAHTRSIEKSAPAAAAAAAEEKGTKTGAASS
jgi:signal transduction histidine kinase